MEPTPGKPTQESVAFFWTKNSKFSVARRADDAATLPGVWGLPSGNLLPDETIEAAIQRIGRDKFGVEVEPVRYVGEDSIDRGTYHLHLREYEVKIVSGTAHVPQPARELHYTQYSALQMTDDPHILDEAATKGSLCSRVYLREQGLWPAKK